MRGDLCTTMKKQRLIWGLVLLLVWLLSACAAKSERQVPGAGSAAAENAGQSGAAEKPAAEHRTSETRTIQYLGQSYKLPAKADKIVIAGSLEAMEDALVLGVKPVGGITIGGKFPEMFKPITGAAESIGEKTQPNMETILKLKPDVILSTTKFKPDIQEKFGKIAPSIPVSHIAADWEANLRLLAELSGKQSQAEQVIKKYKEEVEAARAKLGEKLKDKKVVAVRIRQGNLNIYSADVFFNPLLYTDLGLPVPDEVKAAKSQETISLEKFSAMNPDCIFVQFSEDENQDQPKSLEQLRNNPIWKSINAVKQNKVFVNVVDPLAQGGTAWSKTNFLQAVVEKLAN